MRFHSFNSCIFAAGNYIEMKSHRQKMIEKHANMLKVQKKRKRIALTISAAVVAIPLLLNYYYS